MYRSLHTGTMIIPRTTVWKIVALDLNFDVLSPKEKSLNCQNWQRNLSFNVALTPLFMLVFQAILSFYYKCSLLNSYECSALQLASLSCDSQDFWAQVPISVVILTFLLIFAVLEWNKVEEHCLSRLLYFRIIQIKPQTTKQPLNNL